MIFDHVVPEWLGNRVALTRQTLISLTLEFCRTGSTSARLKLPTAVTNPEPGYTFKRQMNPAHRPGAAAGGIKSRTRCSSFAFPFLFSSSCGWHNLKFFSVLLESFISGSHRSVSYAPDESKLQARPTIVGFGVFHTSKSWLGGRTYQTFCPVMYMRCGSTHVSILNG